MLPETTKARVGGAILGFAIGDALGRPGDGLTPYEVKLHYGIINGFYTPRTGVGGPGSYSMPAQTALTTLFSLADGKDIGKEFLSIKEKRLARGWPASMLNAIDKVAAGSASNYTGDQTLMDGSFMTRALAVGVHGSLVKPDDDELKANALKVIGLTHLRKQARLSGFAMAWLIREIINRTDPTTGAAELFDSEDSYLANLIKAVKAYEDSFKQEERGHDQLWLRLLHTRRSLQGRLNMSEFVGLNGSGRTFQEVISLITFFFMRTPDDYKAAVCNAVSHGGESALIGSCVAALVGAFGGDAVFPEDHRNSLENENNIILGWHEMCDKFDEKPEPKDPD